MASADDRSLITQRKIYTCLNNDDGAAIEEMLKAKEIHPDHRIGQFPLLIMAIYDERPNIVKTLIDNGANIVDTQPLHATLAKVSSINCIKIIKYSLANLMSILDILMDALEKISMETLITQVFAETDLLEQTPFLGSCMDPLDNIIVRFLNLITDETRHFFTNIGWFIYWKHHRQNPFHFAWKMKPDTVSILIDRLPFSKSLINESRNRDNSSPLHVLAMPRYVNLAQNCKLFICGSADPDALNENGSTPLHCAVEAYSEGVVETLLRAGCRHDIRNHNGESPLALALHRYHNLADVPVATRILGLLLSFGANLQKEHYLFAQEENPEMFTDPNMANRFGPDQIRPGWLEALRQLRRSKNMNSLKRICRNVIRRHLKPQADEVIKSLTCIPNNLKSYLLVENEPDFLTITDPSLPW